MKILWVSWQNELGWGGDIVGYRNLHTNKILSKKQYEKMVEREIFEKWNELGEELGEKLREENYGTFEKFRKNRLEAPDTDFEALVEFIVDEDEDLEKYEPYMEMHWLEIIILENGTTIYRVAKEGDLQEATLYNMIRRNTPFDKITIKTLNGICKGLGLTEFEFLTKYRDRFVKPITITIYECINCGTTYHKSDLHEGEEQCRLCHAVLQEKEVELEYEE